MKQTFVICVVDETKKKEAVNLIQGLDDKAEFELGVNPCVLWVETELPADSIEKLKCVVDVKKSQNNLRKIKAKILAKSLLKIVKNLL